MPEKIEEFRKLEHLAVVQVPTDEVFPNEYGAVS